MAESRLSRILIVDDDSVSRELLELLLAREGYVVDQAESGEAALALLRDGNRVRPDAVLADMQMPGITGRALAARMRSLCKNKILMIAMSGSEADPEMLEGFDAFLRKPFPMDRLKDALVNDAPFSGKQPETPHAPVLNDDVYKQLSRSMSPANLAKLYKLCLDDSRHRIVVLRQAADRGDDVECRRQAHAIKGSCGMLGATELKVLAEFIEDQGLVANLMKKLDELQMACSRLEKVLREHKSAPENTAVAETVKGSHT